MQHRLNLFALRISAALTVLAVGLALGAAPAAMAGDWPHWRGPSRNGVSDETGLPVSWGPDENIAWKVEMPSVSGATPIIWGDRIFLNVGEGEDLSLWSLDRKDGTVLWKRPVGKGNHVTRKQNMSSPSPTTDGKQVWVLTGRGSLKAFDFQGQELWARQLEDEYGAFGLNWGYASSPLYHDGALYVQVLHGMKTDEPSYLLSVDALTGENRWRVERPTDALMESPDSYTTPAVLHHDGRTEIVVTGGDYATGHDPATGKELWRAGGLNPEKRRFYRIVASPVALDGMVYVPSRVNPLLAFRAGGSGDITQSHLVWSLDRGTDVPTPATDGKYFYLLSDSGAMSCLDAKTGQAHWSGERVKPGTYSASPVVADGKVYVTSEEGVTTVLAAGPEFKILGENDLGDYTLSSMAISQGQIFQRTKGFLYCIGKPSS